MGRTGCYIVIHAMLQQILARADIDVFSYLLHIRKQRNHLVQTEDQYVFIHDALVEAIEAGETHITKSCLPKYIHGLQCIDVTDDQTHPHKVLEKQYKVCSCTTIFIYATADGDESRKGGDCVDRVSVTLVFLLSCFAPSFSSFRNIQEIYETGIMSRMRRTLL